LVLHKGADVVEGWGEEQTRILGIKSLVKGRMLLRGGAKNKQEFWV
jgi:hypothetical protein